MDAIVENSFFFIWVISFFLFYFSLANKRLSNAISVVLIVFCFFLAGIRSSKFPDYVEYIDLFNRIRSDSLFSKSFLKVHGEIGFKLLVKFVLTVLSDPVFIMFVMAAISCLLFLRICYRYSLNLAAVWLVYFSNSYLLKDLAQIRNSTASLLIVYGLFLLGENRGRIRAYGSFLIASVFFQYLSIVGIFVRFLKNKIIVAFSLVVAVALFFVFDFHTLVLIFGNVGLIGHYAGTLYAQRGYESPWPSLGRVVLVLVFVLWAKKGIKNPIIEMLTASLVMSALCYIAFSGIPLLSHRLGGYFLSVDAFLIAGLLGTRKRFFVVLFLITYSLALFLYNIHVRSFLAGGYESIFW